MESAIEIWSHPLAAVILAPFIGSFLSVLAVRLPEEEPVVFSRSRCRQCGTRLGPLDLIPIFSWLVQRGRCRHCGAQLDWLYPVMEFGALAVAVWAALTVPAEVIWPSCILGWTLLALAVIDWRTYLLPDVLTLPLILAGLAVTAFIDPDAIRHHALGAAAGFLILAGIAWAYRVLRGRDGLGLGDAKLLAAGGAWLGWQALSGVILIAAVSGLAAALIWARVARVELTRETAIPFGPFIAFGIWLGWLYGPLVFA